VALAGLVVLHEDAHALYAGLVSGAALAALIVSAAAGTTTLALVWSRHVEAARYCAAVAVGAIVAAWALAQRPQFLPGLTVEQAAAPHDTLVAVVVAVVGGAIVLFPSLFLLLRLELRGRLGEHGEEKGGAAAATTAPLPRVAAPLAARLAGACLLGAFGLLTVAENTWANVIGVVLLFGIVIAGSLAVAPALLERERPQT
jgi:cytochrome d ubiquinol oxidase subunit II